MKEKAMSALSPYILLGTDDFRDDTFSDPRQVTQMGCQPFVSLLELVSEIYQVNYVLFPAQIYFFFFSNHLVSRKLHLC